MAHPIGVSSFAHLAIACGVLLAPAAGAGQTTQDALTPAGAITVSQKWQFFLQETFTPITIVASAATGGVSQATEADPKYGVGGVALAKRFGAATVDNVTQNFFSDFVMASALHEDNRYRRRGEHHSFWSRFGYAISRAVITRTDTGASTVNWSNFTGTALSVGLSNAYYPMRSRNLNATAINWGTSAGGVGFGNLAPEFLPDFKRLIKRLHL